MPDPEPLGSRLARQASSSRTPRRTVGGAPGGAAGTGHRRARVRYARPPERLRRRGRRRARAGTTGPGKGPAVTGEGRGCAACGSGADLRVRVWRGPQLGTGCPKFLSLSLFPYLIPKFLGSLSPL